MISSKHLRQNPTGIYCYECSFYSDKECELHKLNPISEGVALDAYKINKLCRYGHWLPATKEIK